MSSGPAAPVKPKTAVLSWQERQQALRMEQMIVGLAQPHRGGSESKLRESALGRFVEDYQCGGECYRAGMMYSALVWKWRLAVGADVPDWVRAAYGGSGRSAGAPDPDKEKEHAQDVRDWLREIRECDRALKAITPRPTVFDAARAMILDDREPSPSIAAPLKRGLLALAVAIGLLPY